VTGDAVRESARHLVAVWNPSYARSAMEEHLAVLLAHAAAMRTGELADDAVYVWWGRVRSRNRRTPLGHLDDVRTIEAVLAGEDPPETQLYLTDYRSLYVADVAEIHFGELPEHEWAHVPAYYRTDGLECDFWFKLWDVRRLVTDDILGTIEELKRLRNVHYHDQAVSLYGGMVDLPLIVTRPDGASFFDEDERDVATDSWLWAEFDAQMGPGLLAVERALRDDLLGGSTWGAFDPAVRSFIATGEKVFREHRGDPAFDFSPVLGSFAKALEVHLSSLLRRILPTLPRPMRLLNVNGLTVDLADMAAFGLQQIVQVLAGDRERSTAIAQAVVNGGWLTGTFAVFLDQFRETRNEGAHASRIDRRTATLWRNQLLGVGCLGHLVELARVQPK
jgi:hypothetical protein